MKVLRLYDHLGELKREFNVYVEGEDFKWEASYPEPIWLGTISLEEAGKESLAEPTPEVITEHIPTPEELFPKAFPPYLQPVDEPMTEEEAKEMETDVAIDAMREQEMAKIEAEKEVKREPKKSSRKGSRDERTYPSDYLKSVEVIRQDDPPTDANQGN